MVAMTNSLPSRNDGGTSQPKNEVAEVKLVVHTTSTVKQEPDLSHDSDPLLKTEPLSFVKPEDEPLKVGKVEEHDIVMNELGDDGAGSAEAEGTTTTDEEEGEISEGEGHSDSTFQGTGRLYPILDNDDKATQLKKIKRFEKEALRDRDWYKEAGLESQAKVVQYKKMITELEVQAAQDKKRAKEINDRIILLRKAEFGGTALSTAVEWVKLKVKLEPEPKPSPPSKPFLPTRCARKSTGGRAPQYKASTGRSAGTLFPRHLEVDDPVDITSRFM